MFLILGVLHILLIQIYSTQKVDYTIQPSVLSFIHLVRHAWVTYIMHIPAVAPKMIINWLSVMPDIHSITDSMEWNDVFAACHKPPLMGTGKRNLWGIPRKMIFIINTNCLKDIGLDSNKLHIRLLESIHTCHNSMSSWRWNNGVIRLNMDSGDGLVPAGTKPSPEPMLTNHQQVYDEYILML